MKARLRNATSQNCQTLGISRVCEGVALDVLQHCNGNDVFLTRVTRFLEGVWFNTCNFPKTEVGYYEK